MRHRLAIVLTLAAAVAMPSGPLFGQYAIPTDGLVSWWQAEGDVTDSYGSNDGALVNAMTFQLGVSGDGFDFDGSSNLVLVNPTPDIDGGGQMTIAAWARAEAAPASAGTYTSLVVVGDFMQPSLNGGQCRLLYGSPFNYGTTDSARFYMDCGVNDAETAVWRDTDATYSTGVWHLVVGVFDNGSIDLYVDGELTNGSGSSVAGSAINSEADNYLSIGAHHKVSDGSSTAYFDGQIDEVAVYSRALAASEVRAMFNTAFSASGSDVLASNLRFFASAGTLGAAGATWAAGGFTTDSSDSVVTGVTGVFAGWADGDMSLALYTDDGGNPGQLVTDLGAVAFTGDAEFFYAEFDPPTPVQLEPNTTYWLVLTATGSVSVSIAESTQQEGSWTFIPSYRQSFDAGASWSSFSSSRPPRLHVEGVTYLFRDDFETGLLPGGWSRVVP